MQIDINMDLITDLFTFILSQDFAGFVHPATVTTRCSAPFLGASGDHLRASSMYFRGVGRSRDSAEGLFLWAMQVLVLFGDNMKQAMFIYGDTSKNMLSPQKYKTVAVLVPSGNFSHSY